MFTNIYQKLQTKEGITFVASLALIVGMIGFIFSPMCFGRKGFSPIDSARPSITVQGTGEIIAVPDIAKVSFTVEKSAKTMAEAQTAVSELANATLAQIKAVGIAEKDIKTEGFNAYPKYETKSAMGMPCGPDYCPPYNSGNPVIVGYTVSSTYGVKIRAIDKASDILKLITDANVSSVSGPEFIVDNLDDMKNQAREKAILDAKEQAQILARQLGVRLVEIIDFQVINNGGYPMPMMANMISARSDVMEKVATPEIQPGESTITTQVSVTYRIRD